MGSAGCRTPWCGDNRPTVADPGTVYPGRPEADQGAPVKGGLAAQAVGEEVDEVPVEVEAGERAEEASERGDGLTFTA